MKPPSGEAGFDERPIEPRGPNRIADLHLSEEPDSVRLVDMTHAICVGDEVLKFQLQTTTLDPWHIHPGDLDLRSIDKDGPRPPKFDDAGFQEGFDREHPTGTKASSHRPDGFGERLNILHVGNG